MTTRACLLDRQASVSLSKREVEQVIGWVRQPLLAQGRVCVDQGQAPPELCTGLPWAGHERFKFKQGPEVAPILQRQSLPQGHFGRAGLFEEFQVVAFAHQQVHLVHRVVGLDLRKHW